MKKIKKILVVVDSINVDDSSGSKANVALIHNLHNAEFKLKVYHYTRKDIQLKGIDCVPIPEKKWNLWYFLSRSQRIFTRITKLNINPYLEGWFGFSFTFFNDTSSIVKSISKQSDFKPDLVLTLSKGTSFRPHYALLKLPAMYNKWMAYVHDPYPFHYYPRPYNWVEPGYRKKEQFFREVSVKAAYSAFPSLLLKEWMGSYFPQFLKTGVVIPHQNAKYEIQNTEFPAYFNPSKFNLLHAGNLMKQRSPEGLLQGFQIFLNRNLEARKNARLLLLGNASFHTQLLAGHQKKSQEIYIHIGNVAFDEVFNLQKNVSVNIILESKSEISPFLPGKFPHCVEANKPILTLGPCYSEIRRLLGNDYLYWAEVDDAESISKLIEKLYILWQQDSNILVLNRIDLKDYISMDRLKTVIDGLYNN